MANVIRGESDSEVAVLKEALDAYEHSHPTAEASLYRQSPASIRLRVIDRGFEGMPKTARHTAIWKFLKERVPEDALADISILLMLSPNELKNSFANFEFESPLPSPV